ncbi:hypothetical protein HDU91_003664, partial [Kappamyces sp. JEL0680]
EGKRSAVQKKKALDTATVPATEFPQLETGEIEQENVPAPLKRSQFRFFKSMASKTPKSDIQASHVSNATDTYNKPIPDNRSDEMAPSSPTRIPDSVQNAAVSEYADEIVLLALRDRIEELVHETVDGLSPALENADTPDADRGVALLPAAVDALVMTALDVLDPTPIQDVEESCSAHQEGYTQTSGLDPLLYLLKSQEPAADSSGPSPGSSKLTASGGKPTRNPSPVMVKELLLVEESLVS